MIQDEGNITVSLPASLKVSNEKCSQLLPCFVAGFAKSSLPSTLSVSIPIK